MLRTLITEDPHDRAYPSRQEHRAAERSLAGKPAAGTDPRSRLQIIATHHHFWDRPDERYLLDELLADLNTGHKIMATVFLECRSMYRDDGPRDMRPVGETEFVNGIAAMSASGSGA